jgi:DNA-directed RNA polymerase specialized sigma24 family protein
MSFAVFVVGDLMSLDRLPGVAVVAVPPPAVPDRIQESHRRGSEVQEGSHLLGDPHFGMAPTAIARCDDELRADVARLVDAPRVVIEDACQNAWALVLERQPDPTAMLDSLPVIAACEAQRLWDIEQRDARLDGTMPEAPDPRALDEIIEAREALALLAALPEPYRTHLSLTVAGFSYREIAALSGRRTHTNVYKRLVHARAVVRRAR